MCSANQVDPKLFHHTLHDVRSKCVGHSSVILPPARDVLYIHTSVHRAIVDVSYVYVVYWDVSPCQGLTRGDHKSGHCRALPVDAPTLLSTQHIHTHTHTHTHTHRKRLAKSERGGGFLQTWLKSWRSGESPPCMHRIFSSTSATVSSRQEDQGL